MEKYIFLGLLVISMVIFAFYLYGEILNNKLNKKKAYIGEKQTANRYKIKTKASFSCVILMGFLCVFTFTVKPTVNVPLLKQFNSVEELKKSVKKDSVLQKLSYYIDDSLEVFNKKTVIENKNFLYVLNNQSLIKYDLEKEVSKNYIFDEYASEIALAVSGEYIAAYLETETSNLLIVFNEKLDVVNIFEVNSEIVYLDIKNEMLNILTVSDVKDTLNIKYNDTIDSLEYTELHYNKNVLIENVIAHSCINLKNLDIKQYGICVSNYLYEIDEYLYLLTDIKDSKLETKEVYKYDFSVMDVIGAKVIGADSVVQMEANEGLNIICNSDINNNYISYKFDEDFKVSKNDLDNYNYESLEEIILDNYVNNKKVIESNIKLAMCEDYNVFKYAVIKDGFKQSFIKINADGKIVTTITEDKLNLAFNNKYLIKYNYSEVKEIIIVNNEI